MEEVLRPLRDAVSGLELPDQAFSIALVLGAVLLAILAHRLLFGFAFRQTDNARSLRAGLLRRARRPIRLVFVLIALALSVPRAALPYEIDRIVQHGALVLVIVLTGWTVLILMHYFTDRSLRRYRIDIEDNLRARQHVTQLRVLRRALDILIVIITAATALMTFEEVRQYGVSLFASAGVAGLIVGFAARPILANLIAGVQIALTQPIRIDDVVIVEGEWGWIEEIFATYVVVRIWDWRRMVVPLSYFIENPFQNWTRETASIIGSVFWYVDYTVPVDAVRAKMTEFVEASDHWDGQVCVLQIVDTDKDTVHLRGLMSARNSPTAWDLRCEIRERLIVWLQAEYPGALPRLRGQLELADRGAEQGAEGATQQKARRA